MYDGNWLTWKVGAQEIEWFVKPVAKAAFVVRDISGETRISLADAGTSQTFTAQDVCIDGAKFTATGYTLETSSDHGLTWNNATTGEGNSVTLANNGEIAYRITWNRAASAYLLDVRADEGSETITVSPASQDGYYVPGTQISLTAQADGFEGWSIVPQDASVDGNTLSFAMPSAPAKANAQFKRRWRYIKQGEIENYPAYSAFAAVTDGNWLFTVGSREIADVYDERYFNISHYIKGSGKLDLSNLYQDLADEGEIIYPMHGILSSAMCAPEERWAAWFDGREMVTGVVIPQNILTVEGAAFAGCPNLVYAFIGGTLAKWNIPDNAGEGAFQNCTALATVELPDAATLPHNIFQGCSALSDIVLPATVAQLHDSCFDGVAEIRFDGLPPDFTEEGWANYNGTLAVGCPWTKLEQWKQDSRFVPLSSFDNAETLPNYAAMSAKYGNALVGQWDGQWCFRWGAAPGTVVMLQ